MSDLRKAAEQALRALEAETAPTWECNSYHPKIYTATIALREALAQPEQEPYGYVSDDDNLAFQKEKPEIGRWIKVFTAPPQRTWVDVPDEEIDYLYVEHRGDGGPTAICEQFARAVLAKAKEKNT